MPKKTCIALAAMLCAVAAHAAFPDHAVNMVVPYAAGGPTDTVARVLAESMGKTLGQTVVVENKPSAGGILGPQFVKNAKPDGYTILIHHIGMATIPTLYRKPGFDPLADFEYIGLVNEVPMTLLGKKDLPPATLKELIPYMKANHAKMNLANAGIGAASHLCGLLFLQATQVEMTTIPYKGTGPAMADLLGGQVDLLCDQTTTTTPMIKSGKVKVFGLTAPKRIPSLPDVPTFDEQGLKGADVTIWHGLYAPKGTPRTVIDKLVKAMQEALKDKNVQQRFSELGAVTFPADKQNPQALQAHLKSEIEKWAPIIKKAGVYAD